MLLVVGGLIACASIYAIWFALQSKDFLPIDAVVESSEIEVLQGLPGTMGSSTSHKVVFSYVVDGKDYKESPHVYGHTRWTAERQATDYPVGSKHKIFYNPFKPEQIILEKNLSVPGMAVLFLIGLGLVAIGLHLLGLVSLG